MAYSLRKRLSRRQAKDELRPQTSDEEASSRSSSPLSIDDTSTTTSRSAQSHIASEDLSSTPPPPQQTLRRVSPSTSSINRYKLRAPAAVAPSVSPAKPMVDHKTGKTTAFSEIFDDGVSPIATPPATHPTTPARKFSDPILVRGAEFQLMTAPKNGAVMTRSSSVEVMPAIEAMSSLSITDVPAPRKRLTRSHSRREQRADSGADQETVVSSATRKDSNGVVPAGLTVRKNSKTETPRTPSPNKHKQLPRLITSATPANSPYGLQAAPLVSFCKNGTSTTDNYPSPDAITPDPLIISPGTIPESPTPAAITTTDFRDFATAPGSVIVKPPLYDPTKLPLNQWCSVYGADSRPEHPWGWMKKWTCCSCHAQTMVEQRDCARLDCGHGRCLRSCKVIRGVMAVDDQML